MKVGDMLPELRNYPKLGKRPAKDSSAVPPEGAWPYPHLDLGPSASRIMSN
jgi:hypothetical protein